ncbi:hypothetical protein BHYA_0027g00290 [Botrytis hyacinthi]|uniref:GPI inositol-deacylase winged helix domain-containing protein n=1 Tax=Botrytis hyacinthi TaxID=278943 RepID=A0A4Z1H097_9HELO|nr:hypothetical protein BHYA_0027g00290 [Botrytis hyacinthi]
MSLLDKKLQIDQLTDDKAIREALQSLSPSLFETYERILDRANSKSSDIKRLVRRVLAWTVCSPYPLSTDELLEAIAINLNDNTLSQDSVASEKHILKWCSSLVRSTGQPGETQIELARFTVKEFFLVKAKPQSDDIYAEYRIFKEWHYSHLAKICLTYLLFDDFKKIGIRNTQEAVDERDEKHPFYCIGTPLACTLAPQLMLRRDHSLYIDHPRVDNNIYKVLECLLKSGLVINNVRIDPKRGWSPLAMAVNAHIGWDILSKEGAVTDNICMTELEKIGDEETKLVLRFVEKVTDNNISTDVKSSASMNGHIDVVRLLIDHGAALELKDSRSNHFRGFRHLTAFMLALLNEHIEVALLLEDGGADINALNDQGHSALYLAAICSVSMVEYILHSPRFHQTVSVRSTANITVLMMAVIRGNMDNVEYVLKRSSLSDVLARYTNPNYSDTCNGYTALHFAFYHHSPRAMIESLIQSGLEMSLETELGETHLHIAAGLGNLGLFQATMWFTERELLLTPSSTRNPFRYTSIVDQGAYMQDTASKWSSPSVHLLDQQIEPRLSVLLSIIHEGWNRPHQMFHALQMFLAKPGINLEPKDAEGRFPLVILCQELAKADEPDQWDNWTTLHNSINLLILRGADFLSQDARGNTALHYICEDICEVASILHQFGALLILLYESTQILLCSKPNEHSIESYNYETLNAELYGCSPFMSNLRNKLKLPLELQRRQTSGKLSNAALLNIVDNDNQTALHILFDMLDVKPYSPSIERFASELLKLATKEEVNSVLPDGRSLLNISLDNGYDALSQRLVNMDIDVRACGKIYGADYSPLELLCIDSSENQELIRSMISCRRPGGFLGLTPLFFAVFGDQESVVKMLLQHGADANEFYGPIKVMPLHVAVAAENVSVIEMLMSHGADLHLADADGWTPYMVAWFNYKDDSMVKALENSLSSASPLQRVVEESEDIIGTDNCIHIALERATLCNDVEYVKALSKNGWSPESTCSCGYTILLAVLHDGLLELADCFVDAGVTFEGAIMESCAATTITELFPLGLPQRDSIVVETLKSHQFLEGSASLDLGPGFGDSDFVQKILNKSQLSSPHILRALHTAALNCHTGCVRILLHRLAVQSRNKNCLEAQHTVITHPECLSAPLLCAGHNGSLRVRHEPLANALHLAALCSNDPFRVINELLLHGADLEARDQYGDTALHYALINGNLRVTMMLIFAGANVNSLSGGKQSPVQLAVAHCAPDIVVILHKFSASLETDIYSRGDLLSVAIQGYSPKMVHALMELGMNLNMEDQTGVPVLLTALKYLEEDFILERLPESDVIRHPRLGTTLSQESAQSLSKIVSVFSLVSREIKIPGDVDEYANHAGEDGAPLYLAAIGKKINIRVECMEIPIRHGAKIDLVSGPRGTPLMAACYYAMYTIPSWYADHAQAVAWIERFLIIESRTTREDARSKAMQFAGAGRLLYAKSLDSWTRFLGDEDMAVDIYYALQSIILDPKEREKAQVPELISVRITEDRVILLRSQVERLLSMIPKELSLFQKFHLMLLLSLIVSIPLTIDILLNKYCYTGDGTFSILWFFTIPTTLTIVLASLVLLQKEDIPNRSSNFEPNNAQKDILSMSMVELTTFLVVMAIPYLLRRASTGTGPDGEKSSDIQHASSGYTSVSEIPTDIFDPSKCRIKPLRRLITITHTSTIIVPSSTLGVVPTRTPMGPTVSHIVPSTTRTSTSIAQPTIPPTGITAIALSEISIWNTIAATATDPILKGALKSAISQESRAANLTPGAYTAVITISPVEQTAIDKANKDSARHLHTATIILSVFAVVLFLVCIYMLGWYFLRKHRRRRGRRMPPLTEYIPPNLGSLGGLMAEMGRENVVEREEYDSRADGIRRAPRAPKPPRVHSTLQELEIPEGFAELPGSVPEIKPVRRTELQREGEGEANSEKILYEV